MCVLVDIEHVSVKINAVQTLFCVYSRRDYLIGNDDGVLCI